MKTIADVLDTGGIIYYAPISGGILLVNKDGEKAEIQPTIAEFIELRENGQIERTNSMRQSHHIFHGQVDFYERKK